MTPSSRALADQRQSRILLIGMMGAGKSTVGRLLAVRLACPYLDSDEQVEARTGKTVPQIMRESGEPAFRAEERKALEAASATDPPAVIGVAGGAVLDAANRATIRAAGLVVWLRAEVTTLAQRVGSGEGRPLLGRDPRSALARLYEERRPLYEELADLVVDVDQLSPAEVVDRIEAALTAGSAHAGA
jgi:shikimate kinase